MDSPRLQFLFEKWLRQTATPDEQAEFDQLLEQPRYADAVKALIDEVIHTVDGARFATEGSSRDILEAIFQSEGRAPIPIHNYPGKLRKWWMAAAAVLLLLLGSAAYLLLSNKLQQQMVIIQDDIHPGTSGATLTLADGSKIALDSTGKEALPTQGSTRLIKQDNDQLAYQPGAASKETVFNTLATTRGKQFRVTLPDGTRVWLDAASSLHYPTAFTGKERKVSVSGEAYFEVVKDPSMPFMVTAGNMEVRVLGTDFNINAYSDEPGTKTTLLTGSIKVTSGTDHLLVKPGQQADFNATAGLRLLDGADINQAIAWKNGLISFRSAGLSTIMRQISRWYDVDIIYEGNIPERNFTGEVSRNADLSKLLKILTANGIHFKINGRQLTVMP
jgi:transmembrane sensor